ncbi:hypothetical protein PN652_18865, partial [Odoribacter splanchnicus]|uniref:hypothetical protein n=1 Tax=Odoribacter splanchnicus TaxID=28118 RepID=UPI00232FD8E1
MEYLAFFVQLIEYFLYNIFCCLLPNGKFLSEEAQIVTETSLTFLNFATSPGSFQRSYRMR